MTSIAELLEGNHAVERFDVEVLLASVLKKNRAYMFAHAEYQLTPTQKALMNAYLSRLKLKEPTAYLLGHKDFYNLSLAVSNDVLIPRPETELLVEYALQNIRMGSRILDLGTGSGAIALALAASIEHQFSLTASDLCNKALNIARANARTNKLAIKFIQSDWFEAISGKFDAILCNPPYIAKHDAEVEAGVHLYEPHLALYSGPDGLHAIRNIIGQAPGYLAESGTLVIEHGWQQAGEVQQLFEGAGFTEITTLKDLAGLQRVTLAQRGKSVNS